MPPWQASEPITHETMFQIWTRVGLRTVQDSYPVFNKASLRACMARHSRISQGLVASSAVGGGGASAGNSGSATAANNAAGLAGYHPPGVAVPGGGAGAR
jgi:hypothetical protein